MARINSQHQMRGAPELLDPLSVDDPRPTWEHWAWVDGDGKLCVELDPLERRSPEMQGRLVVFETEATKTVGRRSLPGAFSNEVPVPYIEYLVAIVDERVKDPDAGGVQHVAAFTSGVRAFNFVLAFSGLDSGRIRLALAILRDQPRLNTRTAIASVSKLSSECVSVAMSLLADDAPIRPKDAIAAAEKILADGA